MSYSPVTATNKLLTDQQLQRYLLRILHNKKFVIGE